ncbi:hypothetical protein TrVE_jg1116 [Triparma verrucosa]|uniref:ABM domain-containing protein n=1 Tax=Triparma verrucosa TaxID=1606542 RepID=A0A9W7FNR4_9STRA|nr:hypothetical protein TrVE_jg1116 [Triparma verrucosa]
MAPFCVNVRLQVLPERRDEFLDVIRADQAGTLRDEEGSLQFLVMNDVADPDTFYFHEEYNDLAAFEAHGETAHYQPWKGFTQSSPFKAPIEVNTFVAEGETSPVTREERMGLTANFDAKEKYCVWVNLFPADSVLSDFRTCIAGNKLGTDTSEPLALQYTWGVTSKDTSKYSFFEVYEGEEGFKQHQGAPHFAKWEEFAGKEGVFQNEPEVHFARVI